MKTIPTLPLLGALALVLKLTSAALHAQVPQILNFQGRVAVGTPPVNFNGSGAFKFALVNADGMTTYWSNDGTSTAGSQPTAAVTLAVIKGLYSVLLGDTTLGASMTAIPHTVFANDDVRLRVWFNDGTNGSQLLTPDQRIAAVGYAMVAGDVADGAITADKIADGAVGTSQLAANLSLSGTTTGTFSGALAGNAATATTAGSATVAGSATSFTGALAGEVTGTQGATAIAATTVTGKALTGFNSAVGTVTAADTVIGAINKLDGNIAQRAPLASPTFTGTVTAPAFAGSGAGLTNISASAVTGTIPASQVATPPPGMALIPAGVFTMGDSLDGLGDATPTVSTTVSAFYMDVNEVTLSQWQVVQQWGTLVGGYTDLPAGSGKGATHPVQAVSWYACVKWCNARSEREGKTPVYYTDDAQTTVYRTGNVNVTNVRVNWSANGYRLPTEAEWEKAARGGQVGKRFPWGDTISQKLANYWSAAGGYDLGPTGLNAIGSVGGTNPATSPVGSFAANGYGLNDMAGNVFEWCWDWYGTPYAGGTDPRGPLAGSGRVFRGGGWRGGAYERCADRVSFGPGDNRDYIGFRAVRTSGQ